MAVSSPRSRTGCWLSALGLVAFIAVTLAVTTGASVGIDTTVHDAFIAHRVSGLDGFMVVVSAVFGPAIEAVLVVFVAAAFWLAERPRSAVLLAGAMAVTVVLSTVVKHLMDRPRPDSSVWLGPPESSGSFPSGHTVCICVFTLVAGYLWWRATPTRARLGVWLTGVVALTVLVACSRLYLGVHWFTDTFASVALAVAVFGAAMMVEARWSDADPEQRVRLTLSRRPSPRSPRA